MISINIIVTTTTGSPIKDYLAGLYFLGENNVFVCLSLTSNKVGGVLHDPLGEVDGILITELGDGLNKWPKCVGDVDRS